MRQSTEIKDTETRSTRAPWPLKILPRDLAQEGSETGSPQNPLICFLSFAKNSKI
jgi:hypothetical protein